MAIFWAVNPHLLSQNGKIWREGANLGDPPHAKFCIKKSIKGIYLFGENLHQKLLKPLFTPDKHFRYVPLHIHSPEGANMALFHNVIT